MSNSGEGQPGQTEDVGPLSVRSGIRPGDESGGLGGKVAAVKYGRTSVAACLPETVVAEVDAEDEEEGKKATKHTEARE